MVIVTAKILIATEDCYTLKDKRKIINSIKQKLKNQFNFSIAEVDYQDTYHQSLIGIAFVTNDKQFGNTILSKGINFLETAFPGRLVDYEFDIDIK